MLLKVARKSLTLFIICDRKLKFSVVIFVVVVMAIGYSENLQFQFDFIVSNK